MMKAWMAELIGIGIIGTAMLVPAPKITVHNPRLLYTLALYKAATGDTNSALRLLQEAEATSEGVPATTAHAVSRDRQEPPL
jgi:hypothetical protein